MEHLRFDSPYKIAVNMSRFGSSKFQFVSGMRMKYEIEDLLKPYTKDYIYV